MKTNTFFTHIRDWVLPRKPQLVRFAYSQLVISDEPYLLFTWAFRYAGQLAVRSIHFHSGHHEGSAYVRLNALSGTFDIRLRNLWRSATFRIHLIAVAGNQHHFQPEYQLPLVSLAQAAQSVPRNYFDHMQVGVSLKTIAVPAFDIQFIEPLSPI